MTDLEMVKACAEAMGYTVLRDFIEHQHDRCDVDVFYSFAASGRKEMRYNPLHDDAQAMQLVKKCRLSVGCLRGSGTWNVVGTYPAEAENSDLNRAIVETIAKMQAARNDSVTQKE
jgi:hypothetical protein